MPASRTRDKEATQAAILEAAELIFVAKGPVEASISEIAGAAGVTKSLIHHHFGSKDGLWRAVKSRAFESYAEWQSKSLSESSGSIELLERSMRTYFRFLQTHPSLVRMMGWTNLERDPAAAFEPGQELFEQGVVSIEEAQAQGEIRRDVDPFCLLVTFVGSITHWFTDRATHCKPGAQPHDATADDEFLGTMMRIMIAGIRA